MTNPAFPRPRVPEAVDWETAEITLTPDPCWTPGMEAIAQSWLDLIRALPPEPLTAARHSA